MEILYRWELMEIYCKRDTGEIVIDEIQGLSVEVEVIMIALDKYSINYFFKLGRNFYISSCRSSDVRIKKLFL